MQIHKITFEGTAEEFEAVRPLFAGSPISVSAVDRLREAHDPLSEDVSAADGDISQLTEGVLREALTRRPLSQSQKNAIQAILAAGDEGIVSSDLAQAMELNRSQVAGVMGALGRRIANTRGWPQGAFLFDTWWDEALGQWRYRHFPMVREALTSGAITL